MLNTTTPVLKTIIFALSFNKNFRKKLHSKNLFIQENCFGSHLYDGIKIYTALNLKTVTIYFKNIKFYIDI